MPDELTPEREPVTAEHRSVTRSLTDVVTLVAPIAGAYATYKLNQHRKPDSDSTMINVTVNEAPPPPPQEPEE